MTILRKALPAVLLILAGAGLSLSCFPTGGQTSAPVANKTCYECHAEFQKDELSLIHERNQIACARCHGLSPLHAQDDGPKAKPDFTPRGIAAMKVFCLTCHSPTKHGRNETHQAEAAKPNPADRRTCTQCHGQHRLIEAEATPSQQEPGQAAADPGTP
ncbi:MAG TPA: cytochrome c3 family protein [Phycisphaerae bacterium]|nr:cytochrome c3 family protein [Phycisphaerae bacterium]